jgi:hypothetical protein
MIEPVRGTPTDWTNGTGTFSSGTISIPANPARKVFYIQNQDAGTVTVTIAAVKASDGSATTASYLVASGGASGSQGGSDERSSFAGFVPLGAITITGTAGQKVCVLEI